MLDLHCCVLAFSSWGKHGPLSSCGVWALHCSAFFCWRPWALGCTGFTSCDTWAQYLKHMGLVDLWYVDYSWTMDQTHIPCIGRLILFFFFSFIFISWKLITLQYCSGFCHTLTWISHGFRCVSHPDPHSNLPPHPIPLGLPSAPALSTCLMHPTLAGDLFHTW